MRIAENIISELGWFWWLMQNRVACQGLLDHSGIQAIGTIGKWIKNMNIAEGQQYPVVRWAYISVMFVTIAIGALVMVEDM